MLHDLQDPRPHRVHEPFIPICILPQHYLIDNLYRLVVNHLEWQPVADIAIAFSRLVVQ